MSLQQNSLCRGINRVMTKAKATRFRFSRAITVLTWMVSCLATSSVALAQKPDEAKPLPSRQWALLIGVQNYDKANPLRHTVNDVVQLAKTLQTRGGLTKDHILEITDDSKDPRFQPLKASLLAELPKWLNKVGSNDQILVYFSGHGFRDKDGKLYLAPKDVDPADPATTGIPVEWFREQIAACPASFKLLILDACFAGSEKGEQEARSVTSKDLGDTFKDLERVVTLASSAADEKSMIWEDKKQSLFSYWLNQGLKGHADTGDDGAVDIHELYEYVWQRVKHTAETRFGRKQNPKRIVRAGTDGVPVVLRLRPQTLKQLLADMAEQVALTMEEHRFSAVGVFEFTDGSGLEEALGTNFGPLGRHCSDEVETSLWRLGISVVDRQRLMTAMREKHFSIEDLGRAVAVKELAAKVDGMPVIVVGTFRNRSGREMKLRCKLVQVESGQLSWSAGGTAHLNEQEWAMLGRSAIVPPEDRVGPAPAPGQNVPPVAPQFAAAERIQLLDEISQGPHPLLDPKNPYRVWVKVGTLDARGQFQGNERPLVFRGNNAFLPVRKGEVLQIWVDNKSGHLRLMRLLVDGLNTLPEIIVNTAVDPKPLRAANPAPWITRSQQPVDENGKKGIMTCEWGAHVSLNDARAWGLDPNDQDWKGPWVIKGFVTETGENGKVRAFEIVDIDQSWAARQHFTDQVGLITAAFYAPDGMGRGLGVGAGREINQNLKTKKFPPPGKLVGLVHIRYVDADTLAN